MLRRSSFRHLLLSYLICVAACYPIGENVGTAPDTEVRDEKTFPNGTVVGKYSYMDKDGNPIHVKYYADDQGYGVELSSVKLLKDEKSSSSNKQAKPDQLSKTEPNAELYKYPKYLKKSIGRDQIDFLNKESPKTHLKNKYKSHDYEIYLQNAMPSQQCGRDIEKVKIYNLEKDINKKIRNVLNSIHFEKEPEDTDVETPKFCERY